MKNDPFALAILGRKADRVLQFVARSWKPGTPLSVVVADIKGELARFNLRSAASDQYSGALVGELFRKAGVRIVERPFTSAPAGPKAQGFRTLKDLVAAGRLRLLDSSTQTRELHQLEVTKLAGGAERIAAPAGRAFHDDQACALALGCYELGGAAGGHLKVGVLSEEEVADADPESAIGILSTEWC